MSAGCRALRGALLALSFVLLPALPGSAQEPPGGGFGLPIACPADITCPVQNYIDHDPGPGWRDYTCGPLSYDGHRGIDFRVPTQIEMRRGVPVVAAADGEVIIARDGQPDRLMRDAPPAKTVDERNGNWVAVQHADGWVTTYAHLRQGSVAVKEGQRVVRGQTLGLVGLSGNADFPHIHFALTHRNRLLDPFTGTEPGAACGEPGRSLWSPAAQAQLPYRSGGLLSAGFLGRETNGREVSEGIEAPATIPADAPVLIFWTDAWGLLKGDRLVLTIVGPGGEVFFSAEHVLERDRATEARWIGRKRGDAAWPAGRYLGLYRVERQLGGHAVAVIDIKREVEVR